MNIEITDLDIILDYLETTSLEPHDDYSSEFTYKDQKILYKYIKQLQQENKKQKEVIDKVIELINRMDKECEEEGCSFVNLIEVIKIKDILKEVSE